jgi:DnaJ-domain-containing protein 1
MSVSCHACQRPDPHCCGAQDASPFAILGVDPTLQLRAEDLEEAFHRLIRQVHPDRRIQKDSSPAIRPETLNQAYQDLLSPYLRALALYERATGQTVASVTNDPEVLAWALDLEDAHPEDRRKIQRDLWDTLVSLEETQHWDGFLKTLLQYRYAQEKS